MKKNCPICGCFMGSTQYEYYIKYICNNCGNNYKNRFDDRHTRTDLMIDIHIL
jgi:transposase-like protein